MGNKTFIETICAKHGVLQNLEWHALRLEKTLNSSTWKSIFDQILAFQGDALSPLQRITFTYNHETLISSNAIDYVRPMFSHLRTFIVGNEFIYERKFANRALFDMYLNACSIGECPIFVKDGLVTDTHFSNIVIQSDNCLYTPRKPLLRGTARARLLNSGTICEKDLTINDLENAYCIHLINAMNDLGDLIVRR